MVDTPIRIALVDDATDLRNLLKLVLDRDERLTVVAEAGDGEEGLATIAEAEPDLVVLDLAMPVMDGFAVLSRLRELDPRLPVVVILSGFAAADSAARAVELGAAGYLEKGFALADVADRLVAAYASSREARG